ncbi:hypothetical protein J4Q44_G00336600 [Coregonus suidteri]|uniref:Uncharacterized protein n=1 Tax=Coregonus suidteri TaxID=861788 RepID=A0AAN8KRD5_9TELE
MLNRGGQTITERLRMNEMNQCPRSGEVFHQGVAPQTLWLIGCSPRAAPWNSRLLGRGPIRVFSELICVEEPQGFESFDPQRGLQARAGVCLVCLAFLQGSEAGVGSHMDPVQCEDNAEANSYVVVYDTDSYHYSRDAQVPLQCEDDQFGLNAVVVIGEVYFTLRRCTPFLSHNRTNNLAEADRGLSENNGEMLDLVAVDEQSFPIFTPRPSDHVHLPRTYPNVNNYLTQDVEPLGLIERWYEEPNIVDEDKQDWKGE